MPSWGTRNHDIGKYKALGLGLGLALQILVVDMIVSRGEYDSLQGMVGGLVQLCSQN